MIKQCISVWLILVVLSFGCSTAERSYTSNEHLDDQISGPLQKEAAKYQGPFRNPVIIVHGFLGSNMKDNDTGKNVWGEFSSEDGYSVSDEKMRALSLPMKKYAPLKTIRDNTVPSGALNVVAVKFLGITFRENAYQNLVNVLKEGGYQPEGQPMAPGKSYCNLFQFSYDWRRDLQESASKLHEFIQTKRQYLQERYKVLYGQKNYNIKFDLIGHSMGGLISRYYLRFGTADLPEPGEKIKVTWTGCKYIDRVIILGTPNAGYLDTLLEMENGMSMPPFPPAMISTWPSIYQMMPAPSTRSLIYRKNHNKVVDIYDFKVWLRMKWGLADPKQYDVFKTLLPQEKDPVQRRLIAFDHLKKCLERAKRFKRAMGFPAIPPKGVNLYLVLGNAVRTTRRGEVDEETGEIKVIEYGPGDGKVLASSAMYDERAGAKTWVPFFYSPIAWSNITQLRAAHMGITTAPAFKDNILFLLSAVPSSRYQELIDFYRKNRN